MIRDKMILFGFDETKLYSAADLVVRNVLDEGPEQSERAEPFARFSAAYERDMARTLAKAREWVSNPTRHAHRPLERAVPAGAFDSGSNAGKGDLGEEERKLRRQQMELTAANIVQEKVYQIRQESSKVGEREAGLERGLDGELDADEVIAEMERDKDAESVRDIQRLALIE
ncbi:hypothetical protein N0V88_003508 [Collariella sp. IMI 366227]|nr:hypothetical protein N0V88_003508 [Collariella sp. IMI 366227]